jgi:HTH-type transcriptional regulator/antitoxin HigA
VDIRPISNESDHKAALAAIDALWGSPIGTPDGDRLDILLALVEAYESRRWPTSETADPVAIIAEHMRMSDYSRSDLAAVLGSASRASEILNRKRPLTLPMIQRLKMQWGIPADLLVAPYPLSAA